MKIKNYIFAGLDFIFDEKFNPWFLEANRAPFAIMEYEELYGTPKPFEELAKYMISKGNKICLISSKRNKRRKGIENSRWAFDKLKEKIPNLKLCYEEDNKWKKKELEDVNNNSFKSDCIFRFNHKIPVIFEKKSVVINPESVWTIAGNKLLTKKAVKKHTKLKIPKTCPCPPQPRLSSNRCLPLTGGWSSKRNWAVALAAAGSLWCTPSETPPNYRR